MYNSFQSSSLFNYLKLNKFNLFYNSRFSIMQRIQFIFTFLLLIISTVNCLNRPPTLIRNIDLSTINENLVINSNVFQLVAHDPEGLPVSYELDGTDLLRVDRRTGIIYVAKSIDREKIGEILQFNVILQDQVPPNAQPTDEANIVNISVKIFILDENDNPPFFFQTQNNVTIPEDTQPGTAILSEIIVNDADTVGPILKASCDGCGSMFHLQNIDTPTISLLRFSLVLSQHVEFRLRANVFNISLHAFDGVHNATMRLSITIKDVQNRPPIFIGAKEIVLPENTPVGTIVYHVRAIDGDALNDEQLINLSEKTVNLQFMNTGRKLAYFLDENPGDLFSLDQRNGELKIAGQLDREAAYVDLLEGEKNEPIAQLVIKFRAIELTDDTNLLDDQEISISRTKLTVKLLDVNDEKPIFDKEQYKITIQEDHLPGNILGPLPIHVTDQDLALNALFKVRLLENGSELFRVEPSIIEREGKIAVYLKENVTLDYENPSNRRFNLLLEARELKTKEKFASTARLLINVQDVNDNKPEFSESSYLINLIENAPPGTIIKSIHASDRDSALVTRLIYKIRGEYDYLFDLDPQVGVIRVANCQTPGIAPCLDFERRKFYNLTYTAYDGFGLNTSVPLRIQLLDTNDNSPLFEQPIYEVEVEENANHFAKPLFVHATDADISSILVYSLISETTENNLDNSDIFKSSSLEKVEDTIDELENVGHYAIEKRSIDKQLLDNPLMLFDMLEVPISTLQPVERKSSIETYLNTRLPLNKSPNEHYLDNHKFEKLNNLENKPTQFTIDSRSGEIRVNRPVVYSSKPIILTIKVSDGIHYAKCNVHIVVRDINDNAPVFDRLVYHVNVSETSEIGSFVLRLHATDADVGNNALIGYSLIYPETDSKIVSSSNQDFSLNKQTGILTVIGPLDYDRKNLYTFKVKAEDKGNPPRSAISTLVIQISNENNKNPYFKPSTQMTEVNEHVSIGSRIYKLMAEDPDLLVASRFQNNGEDLLVYRIENLVALDKNNHQVEPGSAHWLDINKFFAIDSNGYLIVVSALRYELAVLVTLNISVIDSSASYPQVGHGILIVKIIDYNDNPPQFDAPWSILNPHIQFTTIEEQKPGTVLGKMHATDIDTDIDYYAIKPPSQYFTIDNQTGIIKISKSLDYETINKENLKFDVYVYDNGMPQLYAQATVHVQLININDNLPVFNQSVYNVSIAENLDWDSFVLKVTATDNDKGIYGKIKYGFLDYQSTVTTIASIKNEQNNGSSIDVKQYFTIDEDTGVIRVAQGANLDREAGLKEINFKVFASDNPSKFNLNPILNEPSIIQTNSRSNGTYSMLESSNSFVDDLYSEESKDNAQTMVVANVYVRILDVNDNAPIFDKKEYVVKIYDYSDVKKEYNYYSTYFLKASDELRNFVLKLNATDADEGLNGFIKYRIIAGNLNNVFELDEITGQLYASKTPLKINRDTYTYMLQIEARDQNGLGSMFDRMNITITIHSVNKYKPRFLFPLGVNLGNGFTSHSTINSIKDNVVSIYENQPVGTRVAEVKAEDLDSGNNGVIMYSFKINGTFNVQETDLFKIDAKSGLITSKVVFDREQQAEYKLLLSAIDFLAEPQTFETLQELIVRINDLDDNLPEFNQTYRLHSLKNSNNNLKELDLIDHNSLFNDDKQETSKSSFENEISYTYLFNLTENLPKSTIVGYIKAIDKDDKPENSNIFYFIIDGNEKNLFQLNSKTGLLSSNQPLDREQQDFYQLIIKATAEENFVVPILPLLDKTNLTTKFDLERQRSYLINDLSLALVGIQILDVNDNEPIFDKELYRVAVFHQAKINDTLLYVKARDADNDLNATLIYSIASIDMYRKYVDDLENPVRPIPSPFGIDVNTGRLNVIHSINQYPAQTRFVVHIEARERNSPFRIVRSLVHVYMYEASKLIKITIRLRPALVEQQRDNIEQLLSENLEHSHLRALITSIKYHVDTRRGKVVHEHTDCFVLVVDERNLADISPEKMISKLDSNAAKLIFVENGNLYGDSSIPQQQYSIEQITLASSMNTGSSPILYNLTSQLSGDMQTIIFFILIILISIGFVSMAVSCCCLKSWYYQKLVERAQIAQQKSLFNVGTALASGNLHPGNKYAASFIADQYGDSNEFYAQSVHSYPATYGCLNGTNGSLNGLEPGSRNGSGGSIKQARSKNSTLRQQVPPDNTCQTLAKDNSLWLDSNSKYYEEQELTVQVATMDLSKDNDSVNYYTMKNKNKNRQRLSADNVDESRKKVNDYHVLKNVSDSSNGHSSDT